MKKVVFVVEGQTERIFIQKFIENIVRLQPIRLHIQQLSAGVEIELGYRGVPNDVATHLIRIIDVSNDEKVNSFIENTLDTFKAKGFCEVYGLRDRYSGDKKKQKLNITKIDGFCREWSALHEMIIEIIVAIEEVEAWFLSVPEFLNTYNASLTPDSISLLLGWDLSNTDIETIPHPSATINKILESIGHSYNKKLGQTHKITEVLNYDDLYLTKPAIIPSLKRFTDAIDNALA